MPALHNPATADRLDRALLAELTADPSGEWEVEEGRVTLSEEKVMRGPVEVVRVVQLTSRLQRREKVRIISSGRRIATA